MNTPTHTHELRHNSYNSNRIPASALHVHVKGTEQDCYKYLEDIAEKQNRGVGLLLNNGGWKIVCLEEERIEQIKEDAPELLKALKNLHAVVMRSDDRKIFDNKEGAMAVANAFDIIKKHTKNYDKSYTNR